MMVTLEPADNLNAVTYHLSDLVNLSALEQLLSAYQAMTRIPLMMLDAGGEVLFAMGWQEICLHFHRQCPETVRRCRQSDFRFFDHLEEGLYCQYRCENGFSEYAAPILVDGAHVGTIILGQLLHDSPDEDWFRRQAARFGFEESAYLEALRRVPVIPEAQTGSIITFVARLAQFLAANGLDRLRDLETERALQESQERFRELAELLPQIVYEMDLTGRFTFVNHNSYQVSQYSQQDFERGLYAMDMLPPEQQERGAAEIEKVFTGQVSSNIVEYDVRRKDGSTFPALMHSSAIIRDGVPVGMRGIIIDMSDWKQTQAELQQHKDHLEELVAARTADLEQMNAKLRAEVRERKQADTLLRQYQERLRALALEMTRTAAEERRQIARNLHDQVGQLLFGALLHLGKVQQQESPESGREELNQVRQLLEETILYSRSLTAELSPPVLYEFGFSPALRWLAKQFSNTYDLAVHFIECEMENTVSQDLGVLLFGMVRELLFNVMKHAQASQAVISVEIAAGEYRVAVEDDGRGFDPEQVLAPDAPRAGFGLFSIRERLRQTGGTIRITATPGSGTRVELVIPETFLS